MVNGVSTLLMGPVTAGLLLVESPFQGSESHRRAVGGTPQPRTGWIWGPGDLPTIAPRAGAWGQLSPAVRPFQSGLVNFTVVSVLLAEMFSQQGVRQPSSQAAILALTCSLSQQDIDGQALLLLTLPTVQECMELKLGPAIKLCHQIERVKVAFYAQYAN